MPNPYQTLGNAPITDDTDYLTEEIQFDIDSNMRTIAIPTEGVVIGVQGDKNVNRVNFRMPAWYNGFDMSTFQPRINFVDPEGNVNYYTVTDMKIYDPEGNEVTDTPTTEDIIYFTWLVDSYATNYVGTVVFNVRFTKFNPTTHALAQAFNTTKGACQVLEGITLADEITQEQQEDLLFHMTSELQEVTDKLILDIEAKGAETLESIPDEYDDLSEDVTNLKSDFNVVVGKNLIGNDPNVYYPVNIAKGEYITTSSTGTIPANVKLYTYDADKEEIDYWSLGINGEGRTIQMPDTSDVKYLKIDNKSSVPIQVEKGTTATDYEEYHNVVIDIDNINKDLEGLEDVSKLHKYWINDYYAKQADGSRLIDFETVTVQMPVRIYLQPDYAYWRMTFFNGWSSISGYEFASGEKTVDTVIPVNCNRIQLVPHNSNITDPINVKIEKKTTLAVTLEDLNNPVPTERIEDDSITSGKINADALDIANLHRYFIDSEYAKQSDGSRIIDFTAFETDTPVRITLSSDYSYWLMRYISNETTVKSYTFKSGQYIVDDVIPAGCSRIQLVPHSSSITDAIPVKIEKQDYLACAIDVLRTRKITANGMDIATMTIPNMHDYIINDTYENAGDGSRLIDLPAAFTEDTPVRIVCEDGYAYWMMSFWTSPWTPLGHTYTFDSGETVANCVIPEGCDRIQLVLHRNDITEPIRIQIEKAENLAPAIESAHDKIKSIETAMEKQGYGLMTSLAMFRTFGCVGDSYTHCDAETSTGDWHQVPCPWPKAIANRCGNTSYNYGQGGQTAYSYDDSYVLSADPHDMYFLALGINDSEKRYNESTETVPTDHLGTISDIKANYTLNPNTFYGCYGRLIAKIMAHAPKAKYVMITIPLRETYTEAFNVAIREIAEYFEIPCIEPYEDPFFSTDIYNTKSGGHPTASGYIGMSYAYERLFSKCVEENPDYFLYTNEEEEDEA